MRKYCLLLTVVPLLVVSACAPPAEPKIDLEAERAALRKAVEAYHEAGESVDIDAFVSLHTTDAVVMQPNMETKTGSAGVREFVTAFAETPGFQVSFEMPKIEVAKCGDMGYTLGNVAITVDGPDGEPVTAVERDFHLWTKQVDGAWKLHIDIWNSPDPLPGE